MLKGKKIVLGITGSIAAYKACLILRLLIRQGAEVQVVITDAGKQFITPVTLSALSGKPVVSEFFTANDGTWHSHVDLGIWADAMLIAPCTASSLGKMVHGIADNMLITTYLSMKAPVFVAPAMDLDMYAHPSTQANLDRLRQVGNVIIEPQAGFLASGLEGKGRMEEPENIVAALEKYFEGTVNDHISAPQSQLAGQKVLITAGPTYEKIDPVRFIGNYSSGKMGFALAEECNRRGAEVVLVAGPVNLQSSANIRRIDVESADEMHAACRSEFANANAAILCAAVADFKPATIAAQKIKREGNKLTLELTSTHDIAAALGREKKGNQVLAGFALETNNEEANAQKKLESKNLDFIVLNSLRNEGTCFGTDNNMVNIISATDNRQFGLKSKAEVAKDIVDYLCERMEER